MNKFIPKDLVEIELLSAFEGCGEKIAEEAIPREFREFQEKLYDNTTYYKDPVTGEYDYLRRVPNQPKINRIIKEWAKTFADNDIPIDKLNFDDYKISGITLDKFPKDSVVVFKYGGDAYKGSRYKGKYPEGSFHVFDNRDGVKKTWDTVYFSTVKNKKGEKVETTRQIDKVPDSQVLEEASEVWVFPAEDLEPLGSTKDLRKKRQEQRRGSITRDLGFSKKPQEERFSWYGNYDASGYFIDTKSLEHRLKAYRAKKLANSGGIERAKKALTVASEKYNTWVKKALDLMNKIFIENAGEFNYGSYDTRDENYKWMERSNSVRKDLKKLEQLISDLSQSSTDSGQDYGDKLRNAIDELENFYGEKPGSDYNYYGKSFRESIERFINNNSMFLRNSSSTESIRGQLSNKTLQATEGYFVSNKILAALEDFTEGNNPSEIEDSDEDSATEDTVKIKGKWVNKGKEGTHGKFKTKKAANAQRKAMFANGYKK